jgi:hypothetical protein
MYLWNYCIILDRGITLGILLVLTDSWFQANQKTHVVYSIPCCDCEKEYLGHSKCQFGTRLKGHQKTVSTLKGISFSRT